MEFEEEPVEVRDFGEEKHYKFIILEEFLENSLELLDFMGKSERPQRN